MSIKIIAWYNELSERTRIFTIHLPERVALFQMKSTSQLGGSVITVSMWNTMDISIQTVSANHSQITVAVAGLAFTILLLAYPLFISRNEDVAINSKILSIGLAFFFFSLTFGPLSSFEYSVISGDKRPDTFLRVTWTFPSLTFGISVTTLFAGFVHIAGSYSSTGISIEESTNRIIKFTSNLIYFATVLFITRTNYKSLKILAPNFNVPSFNIWYCIGCW